MKAQEIIAIFISFYEKRGHKKIAGASLIPENDPTTLFTSSGMQPLITYLLGEPHPAGTRLVDVQNSFRAQDIDEIGNNRHTTFFRMLGNWSLGDYFKSEQLPWFWEFLTNELKLDPSKLYVTVFDGDEKFRIRHNGAKEKLKPDIESYAIWAKLFNIETNDKEKRKRIRYYGPEKNWWSRSGTPDKMPNGEPGGPDSEVFYDFGEELKIHENSSYKNTQCHPNCDCGRFMEIGNSVFMQYKKIDSDLFEELPNMNVDFGGGLERLIAATENQVDVFQTSLFKPIIASIEKATDKQYAKNKESMRVIADHFTASIFITSYGIVPSNKEQGYIVRRLIRRGFDNVYGLGAKSVEPILEAIVEEYKKTDPELVEKYEIIKNVILEEVQKYDRTKNEAKRFIEKKYPSVISNERSESRSLQGDEMSHFVRDDKHRLGDELLGTTEITSDDAFLLYTTHGLSPTQIKSLGYTFDDQKFAKKMEEHANLSRVQSAGKFKGGLADTKELTIKGHTATHLLHQAIRDLLGKDVYQKGSNITAERVRFDFNFDRKLSQEEVKKLEKIVNEKIKENLPVRFEMMPLTKAKEINAIGLFDEKYQENVKVYIMGGSGKVGDYHAYSKEFCGGPHVATTSEIKSFSITKQEKLGQDLMRLYAVVE